MKGVTKTLNQLREGKINAEEATKRLYHIKHSGDKKAFAEAIRAYTKEHGYEVTNMLFKFMDTMEFDEWKQYKAKLANSQCS